MAADLGVRSIGQQNNLSVFIFHSLYLIPVHFLESQRGYIIVAHLHGSRLELAEHRAVGGIEPREAVDIEHLYGCIAWRVEDEPRLQTQRQDWEN